jgi:hypothetical protein
VAKRMANKPQSLDTLVRASSWLPDEGIVPLLYAGTSVPRVGLRLRLQWTERRELI